MKKRVCGIILIISIFMTFVPYIYAATVVDSGACGDNATWSLDSSGTLTISGTGEIYDGYGENSEQPWYDLRQYKIGNYKLRYNQHSSWCFH